MLSAFGASRDYDSFDIIPVRCVSRVNFLSHGRHLPACASHPSSSVSFQHTLSGQGGGWFHQGEGRARGSVRWDGTLCSPWRVPPCVGRLEGYARLIGSGRVFRRFGWLSFAELEGLAKKIQGGCVDCSRAIRAGRGWRLAMVAGWSLGTSDFKVSFLSLTNDHSDGRR